MLKNIGRYLFINPSSLVTIHNNPAQAIECIRQIRKDENIPFLSTDRNMLNLPGVGKSMSFRVIGITNDGRRILLFKHDHNRKHSPIIYQMGEIIIIESKSIAKYLEQIKKMGGKPSDYKSIWGYSMSETESRAKVFEYPSIDDDVTHEFTNLVLK